MYEQLISVEPLSIPNRRAVLSRLDVKAKTEETGNTTPFSQKTKTLNNHKKDSECNNRVCFA